MEETAQQASILFLDDAIETWHNNALASDPGEYLIAPKDLPLCRTFLRRAYRGCPVAEKTGLYMCAGTPYAAAAQAWIEWLDGADSAPAHAAAISMVSFLQSIAHL